MKKNAPNEIQDEILKALIFPDFVFYRDNDMLVRQAVERMVSALKGSEMSLKDVIIYHRILLLKEASEECRQYNIKRILVIFKSIKNLPEICRYLLEIVDELPDYMQKDAIAKSLPLPHAKQVENRKSELKQLINEFME